MIETYLLIVRPFDASLAFAGAGLPSPFGEQPFGDELDLTFSGGLVTAYYSDTGYVTAPDDDPPNTLFERRLSHPGSFATRLFEGGDPLARAVPAFGMLTLDNGDGGLDDRAHDWYGRSVTLLRGDKYAALDSFTVVYRGRVEEVIWDFAELRIALRDRQGGWDRPLQGQFYAGTGGLEGGADLANRPKPLRLGAIANAAGVLVVSLTNLF